MTQLKLLALLLCTLFVSSCAKQYLYRFPSENERKRYKPEEVRWVYKGATPDTIIVTDGEKLYRLAVTDKTKLEVYTTFGEKFKLQLKSIAVTSEGDFLSSSQLWKGYDFISRTDKIVAVKEITNVVVVSSEPAIFSQ